jgi:bacterioferritin-associated ferredoxin
MTIIGTVLLIVGLALIGCTVVELLRLRRTARQLENEVRQAAARAAALPPDLVEALGVGGRRVITIELLNPFELAGRSSWFARPLSAVTPDLLRNVVYQRAVTMFRELSSEYGVEADVRLHRAE